MFYFSITLLEALFFLCTAAELETKRLIIDTDGGIDDAVALFFALTDPTVKVEAITCAKGNTKVDNVVVNVLKVLHICNKKSIPVYAGNDYGLTTNLDVVNFFGKDGLGDLSNFPNPPSVKDKQKENAAVEIVKLVKKHPGAFTLVFLGPLTNLALAISIYPALLSKVDDIIIMGGSLIGKGNQSPGVEFNFSFDPDAASLVLKRAANLSQMVTVVALEPINEGKFSLNWRFKELAKLGRTSKIVTFINELEVWNAKKHPFLFSHVYVPYEAGTLAVALVPNYVAESSKLFAEIDPYGQAARGVLLIDYYNITGIKPNVNFVTKVNANEFQQRMYNNFKNYK